MHVLLSELLSQTAVLFGIFAASWGWGRVAFHLGRNLARRRRTAPPTGVEAPIPHAPPSRPGRPVPRGGIGLDHARSDAAIARTVWPLALGYSVVASVLGVLGLVGLLYSGVVALVTLGGCVAAAYFLRDDLRHAADAKASGRTAPAAGLPFWTWFALAAAAIGLGAMLTSASLPSTSFDALVHAFHLPRRMLDHASLLSLPDLDESYDPPLGFLGIAWGMSLGGTLGAQAAASFWAVLFALAVYESARLWLPPRWSVVAGGAALLIPAVQAAGSAPLFDAGGAAFFTLAWTAWRRARRPKCSPGWSILAGWMLGTAVALQPRMILPSILLVAFTMVELLLPGRSGLPRRGLKPILLGLAAALVVAGPWLVRAAVCSGEPFHPFQASVFGLADDAQRPIGASLASLLRAPFAMTLAPETFGGRDQQLGPLLLAVWPAVLLCRRRKTLLWLGLWTGAYLIVWIATRQNLRFFLPAVPWAVVAGVIVLRRLTGESTRSSLFWSRGVAFVLALLVFLPVGLDLRRAGPAADRLARNEPLFDYLARVEPTFILGERCRQALSEASYPASSSAVPAVPAVAADAAASSPSAFPSALGAASSSQPASPQPVFGRGQVKILSQEPRAYFLPGEVVWEPLHRGRTKVGVRTADAVPVQEYFQQLKAAGFTHLLLAQTFPADPKAYDSTLAAWVRQADRVGLILPVAAEYEARRAVPPRRYRLLVLK